MKRYYILTVLFALFIMNACNKDQLDQINPSAIADETYFKNETEITTAVNGIYALVQSANLAGREYFFLNDLRSDEMSRGTGGGLETPRAEVLDGVHSPTNAVLNSVWNGLYQVIHRANNVIERAPLAKEVQDPAIVEKRIAEAKFLRGWAYSELVVNWGRVPLLTKYVKVLTETYGRASEEDVYQQIIADLNDAQAGLTYVKDVPTAELGRATKEAAQTILGRVYMQRGKYAEARTELLKVVNSPSALTLAPNYFDNFTEEGEFNKESIWEIGYTTVGDMNWDATGRDQGAVNERSVRSQEYSAVGWRNIIPSASLLDEYERPYKGDAKEDPRLKENFYFIGDKFAGDSKTLTNDMVPGLLTKFNNVDQKISWRKYSIMYKQDPGGYLNSGINIRIIRLGEVLLNLAECDNELDMGAKGIDYLNQIRSRASVQMPPYPTARFTVLDKIERRKAIQHERRVELAGEQVRNRDIIRYRKLGTLAFGEPLPYFDANKHALLPIPQNEIDTNDKIEQADQNPGY